MVAIRFSVEPIARLFRAEPHSCLLFGNAMLSLKNYSAGDTSLHGIMISDKEP
jgi:hypothetical protein